MGSMVRGKMKARRGNGTPHPKGRRASVRTLQARHNLSDEIQHNVPHQANDVATRSSIEKVLAVHSQVTRTLHEIDTLVLRFQNLASSNHLVLNEVQDFADALASIDENLQDWNDFLKTVAKRSPLMHISLEQEQCNRGIPESTPILGRKCTDLSSQIDDLVEQGAISYSPLVATGLLECESPFGSEPLICTPLNKAGSSRSSQSPLPQTPRMLSPPRSVRVHSTISDSPLLSTPARFLAFDGNQGLKPQDLLTPEGSTCRTQFVFETPLAQVTHHGQLNDLSFPHTPKFGASPPRTCRPLRPGEIISTESDPSPIMPSPFRTPGILLECKSEISDSCSAGSPGIVDDITTSMVKRLGPKGLEERLWQELAIRKADILQPVKPRS